LNLNVHPEKSQRLVTANGNNEIVTAAASEQASKQTNKRVNE